MSNYETMNVRQKLAKARLMFLNEKINKSGKNLKLEFKYFELQDIVPPAIRIFARVGLLGVDNIVEPNATLTVYNTDNLEEDGVVFTMPYRENENIISREGKNVTNNLQTLGMSITYIRRYLWMMALDITEPDSVEPLLGEEEEEEVIPKPKKKERKAPATTEERKEAKKELVAADKQASEEQIDGLKSLCKELKNLDENQEDFISQIALKTDGFTRISETACNALCDNLKEMIGAYGTAE